MSVLVNLWLLALTNLLLTGTVIALNIEPAPGLPTRGELGVLLALFIVSDIVLLTELIRRRQRIE